MCWLAYLLVPYCITCWLPLAQQGGRDYLSGTVVSDASKPIGGVKIFAWKDATTDADGRFEIPTIPHRDSVVYFQKEGFRPMTLVVEAGTRMLKVVLEDDEKTAWRLPACSSTNLKVISLGVELKVLLPPKTKVRRIRDIDYQEYVVSLVKDSRRLQLWYGPFVMAGQLLNDLILRSASFEERSIHAGSGQVVGDDVRGKTRDGLLWRTANFPGLYASAIYDGVPREIATAYDRIIDSACQPRSRP